MNNDKEDYSQRMTYMQMMVDKREEIIGEQNKEIKRLNNIERKYLKLLNPNTEDFDKCPECDSYSVEWQGAVIGNDKNEESQTLDSFQCKSLICGFKWCE